MLPDNLLALNGLELFGESRQKYLVHQICRQGVHFADVGLGVMVRRTKSSRRVPVCSDPPLPCRPHDEISIFAFCRASPIRKGIMSHLNKSPGFKPPRRAQDCSTLWLRDHWALGYTKFRGTDIASRGSHH